jgi:hypothetical protein
MKTTQSTSPKSKSPKSKSPKSTSPQSKSPKSTSPKSKSPKSTSPKIKTIKKLNNNQSVFTHIRSKFGDDIYNEIMKKLDESDWDLVDEFEKSKERKYLSNRCINPNYDPNNIEFKWNPQEVQNEINRLTNKNETNSESYNYTMTRMAYMIICYSGGNDDEIIMQLMRKRFFKIFIKCAKIRPYNQETLQNLFSNALSILNQCFYEQDWCETDIFIQYITNFIKPEYCEKYDMYEFLKGYIYCLRNIFRWCDRKNQRVIITLYSDLKNLKDKNNAIYLLMKKIDNITKHFAKNKFRTIKNIKEFISLYFKKIITQDPEKYDTPVFTKLFIGNSQTKKLLEKIEGNHFEENEEMNYVLPEPKIWLQHSGKTLKNASVELIHAL